MSRISIAMLLLAVTAGCSNEPVPANEGGGNETPPVSAQAAPLAIAASDQSLWGPCPPIFTAPGCQIAVLQGDPAKPNADVLLRVPGGYAIPPHRHTSAERMVLLSGELRVRYQGNEPATLAAGHYAYGPAGMPHEAACLSAEPCTLFIAFEGPVDAEPVSGTLD